jgi:predicted ferric reductase
MSLARAALIWGVLTVAVAVPLAAATTSPQLAWRDPIYIGAGFAGIIALCLLLVQPLLANGVLPGLKARRGRQLHGWIGGGILALILLHVAGLWITSPPDMVDALLFASPTPFSAWGVVAMWAALAAALVAVFRRRMHKRPGIWRTAHLSLAVVVVAGSVVHAALIVGTMETASKLALCALVVAATARLLYDLRIKRTAPAFSPRR